MWFRTIFPVIFSAFLLLAGCASLDNAIVNGDIDQVKTIIAKDRNKINYTYKFGETPLHKAVYWGHLEIIKYLVSEGAKINAKDKIGYTALHDVIQYNKGKKREKIIRYLLSNGADPNTKSNLGTSPLLLSIRYDDLTVIKDIVAAGGDVNTRNNAGITPILASIYIKNIEIADYLISEGADVNVIDSDGLTPIQKAVSIGNLDITKLLMSKNADVNTINANGRTLLQEAVLNGNIELVKFLISKSADINESSRSGATALHYAAAGNDKDLVELLISKGADINSQDNDGKTALSYAKENGHAEIVEFLASKGISSGQTDIIQQSKTDLYSKTYQDIIPKSITPEVEKYNKSTQAIPSNVDFGRYFSLVIGINNYQSLPKLKTAINDANAVADLLKNGYSFSIDLLTDATRSDILLALSKLRKKLTRRDNLLIYYAGHGWLDVEADEGYWLPLDAEPNNDINWVSNSSITAKLKAIEAKHVLIVSDSCYSGKLGRGVHIKKRTPSYFTRISQKKVRSVISSGGLEPVADSGGEGNHSVFATAFINALKENQGIIDGTQLFLNIRRPIMLNSDQTPEYSDIRKAGHEGGDFLFVRKN
jgi:ankyrin repeat protein